MCRIGLRCHLPLGIHAPVDSGALVRKRVLPVSTARSVGGQGPPGHLVTCVGRVVLYSFFNFHIFVLNFRTVCSNKF